MDMDYCETQTKRAKTNKEQHIEQDHQQVSTGIEALPREIIFDILSKLPISSLVRFTYVCKTWRLLLSQDPSLAADLCASRLPEHNPCLIFHCDFPIRNQLYFADFDADNDSNKEVNDDKQSSVMIRKILSPFCSSMPEYDVVGSCNGLLCLSDSLYNESLYIYNPFTRDFRELPKTNTHYPNQEEVVFGFGFSPVTEEYKVLKITYYRNNWQRGLVRNNNRLVSRSPPQSEGQVLTLGGNSGWRSLGKVSHCLHRWPAGQVLVRGRLHWVTGPRRNRLARNIAAFDLADEQFWEVPGPDVAGLRRCEYHLFATRERLAAAFRFTNGKVEIWVMKEYGVKESWVREYVIGSYNPKGIKQEVVVNQVFSVYNKVRRKWVKVLCVLKNGQVLLEYKEKSRALVVYDPNSGKFRDVILQGMSNYWFQTVVHVGSLNRIDSMIGM